MPRLLTSPNRRYWLYVSAVFGSLLLLYVWHLEPYRTVPVSQGVSSGDAKQPISPLIPSTPPTPSTASEPQFKPGKAKPPGETYSRTLVMAKVQKEDISWLVNQFPNETLDIYLVDDPPEKLRIPTNKGREAMVYLSYLIDNYDNLPDVSLFFHPHQIAWHNNELQGQNAANMLETINNNHIARVGYMPARCMQDPGCPHWLRLDLPPEELDEFHRLEEKYFTSKTWRELHPQFDLPEYISAPCCSQFGLSRERIRAQPVSEYKRYRDWLLNTDLEDEISGRWMEYGWHILFTGQVEFCPSQNSCYCDGYGICFGGDAQFQDWLDRKQIKDDLHKKADELRDRDEAAHQEEINRLRTEAYAIDEVLTQEYQAAIERGKDPRNRALDCGREWHEGDGF